MTHGLSVEGDEGAVCDEVREQLFLMLREAVRNAASHSGASKVSVAVRTDREGIVGVVVDDGRASSISRAKGPKPEGWPATLDKRLRGAGLRPSAV